MAAGLNNPTGGPVFQSGSRIIPRPVLLLLESEPAIPEKPGPDANLKPGQPDAIPTPNRPEIPSTPPTDFPEIPKPQPPQSPFPAHPEADSRSGGHDQSRQRHRATHYRHRDLNSI